MSVYQFQKTQAKDAEDMKPGEWKPCRESDFTRSASICCPTCGQRAHLEHDIADDGMVSPSIVCPVEGCDFHVHGQLLGWDPESTP